MTTHTTFEDLPQEVKNRIDSLPDGTWAGPLQNGLRCSNCGENSWHEMGELPEYSNKWAHDTEAYRCLYCGATGGIVFDHRQSSNTHVDVAVHYVGSIVRG